MGSSRASLSKDLKVRRTLYRIDYVSVNSTASWFAATAVCHAWGLAVVHSAPLRGSTSPRLCVRKLTLMIFESVIKIFDTIFMTFESSIKTFDATVDKIFKFAIMAFDSADMVFVAYVATKFGLCIDKKFDLCIDKKFDIFIAKKFDPSSPRSSTPSSSRNSTPPSP
jgi:hypothetical protein